MRTKKRKQAMLLNVTCQKFRSLTAHSLDHFQLRVHIFGCVCVIVEGAISCTVLGVRRERTSVEKESNLESYVHSFLKFQLCSRYLKSKYSGLYPVTNFAKKKKK